MDHRSHEKGLAMKSRYLLFTIAMFLGITPAFGGYIDFTVAPFDEIDNQSTWSTTVDGIEITFTAYPEGATFYYDNNSGFKDGLGIVYAWENDETEYPEFWEISFSESVLWSYAKITDLFNEWGYLEIGFYSYTYDGTPSGELFFTADPGQTIGDTYGEYTLNVDQYVDSIYFYGYDYVGDEKQNHEFSVGGIDITKVPEPSTLLLLSTGLLVGTAFRKRLK